jgi:hypothetical protein
VPEWLVLTSDQQRYVSDEFAQVAKRTPGCARLGADRIRTYYTRASIGADLSSYSAEEVDFLVTMAEGAMTKDGAGIRLSGLSEGGFPPSPGLSPSQTDVVPAGALSNPRDDEIAGLKKRFGLIVRDVIELGKAIKRLETAA